MEGDGAERAALAAEVVGDQPALRRVLVDNENGNGFLTGGNSHRGSAWGLATRRGILPGVGRNLDRTG